MVGLDVVGALGKDVNDCADLAADRGRRHVQVLQVSLSSLVCLICIASLLLWLVLWSTLIIRVLLHMTLLSGLQAENLTSLKGQGLFVTMPGSLGLIICGQVDGKAGQEPWSLLRMGPPGLTVLALMSS